MNSNIIRLTTSIAAAALTIASLSVPARAKDGLEDGFRTPPQPARPHVWWHWMSGNVTEEGAKLDLEWMQRVGVGGVHAFSGGQLVPTVVPNPAPFMSDVWKRAYRASVERARAAGMDVAIAGSPGWSETGGPWVKPEQGMKKYVWTETEVTGGARGIVLPKPPGVTGPFAGIAPGGLLGPDKRGPQASGDGPVIAFRTPDRSIALPVGTYRSQEGPVAALATSPTDLSVAVKLPMAKSGDTFVDVDMGKPVSASALIIASEPASPLEILASDDGTTFRSIRRVEVDKSIDILKGPAPQQTVAFAPVTARFFRVRFEAPTPGPKMQGLPAIYRPFLEQKATAFTLRTLRFVSGARVQRFESKAGFQAVADFTGDPTPAVAAGSAIDPASIVDLTGRVRPDGTLNWTPPAGRWTVLRFGWSLTGAKNAPAEPSATGLEVDKLDRVAVRDYIEKLFARYRDDAGVPLGANGIDSLLTDSWEAGVQNWTPGMLDHFRRLRGYDPTRWLPVLAGHVVGDAARSDAFLYDYRQTLKDLLVDNHYGELAAATREQGLTYYTEALGDGVRAIVDGMTAKARSDVPTGEFWYRPFATDPGQPPLVADLQEAASAAHIYGKPLVAAESMTVMAGEDPWAFSPAMLKPVADQIFALGVNRMLIHDSHMQPFVDRKPGLMLGFFGQFFNRNDTWAERARPWTDYLSRTAYLLQQGRFVADVAYFYGEEKPLAEIFDHRQNSDVPAGYGFDYVNPEALFKKLSVRDGKIVTQSGMQYRLLFVPPMVTHMTLAAIHKLEALARAGAVIVARKPVGGLGMASSDASVAKAVAGLWGTDGAAVRKVGRGRLYTMATLAEALTAEGVMPDVQANGAQLLSVHRTLADADLYFLTNRAATPVTTPVTFRVAGRAPELWSAEDGSMRPLSYVQDGKVTRVTLPLDGQGAGFVLFRKPSGVSALTVAAPAIVATRPIAGPWTVTFEAKRGAPPSATFPQLTDWSAHADPGIRYFSGAATYSRTVTVEAGDLASGRRIMLDLGSVRELATVTINGSTVGTAWHAPYRLDVTDKLRSGSNKVEIEVINLWPNRLIGDKQPGATPVTYAPQSPYKADSPLLSSGLLGPVNLVVEDPVSQTSR